MVTHRARLLTTAGAVVLVSAAALPDVTILGQPGTHATIQAAVDAAVDGDVLLVAPGTYAGFTIDNKSLSVVALPGSPVNVNTQCAVLNLAGKRSVLLSSLRVTGQFSSSLTIPALVLDDDAGHVRAQACAFKGGQLSSDDNLSIPAGHGVHSTNSSRVVFTQCTLEGRDAGFNGGLEPYPGGDGLNATNSTIALYDCTVMGGDGSHESNPTGGTGGNGCVVDGFGVFSSGSTIKGGRGGGADYIGCLVSGDGGNGLVVRIDSQAQLLDTTCTKGLAGGYGQCGLGSDGEDIVAEGTVNQLSGTRRKLSGPSLASDNAEFDFVVTGEPGDSVWLWRGYAPLFRYLGSVHGVVAVQRPRWVPVVPMGTIGASGTLTLGITLGDITWPQPGWTWFLQAFCVDAQGEKFVSSPLQLVLTNT